MDSPSSNGVPPNGVPPAADARRAIFVPQVETVEQTLQAAVANSANAVGETHKQLTDIAGLPKECLPHVRDLMVKLASTLGQQAVELAAAMAADANVQLKRALNAQAEHWQQQLAHQDSLHRHHETLHQAQKTDLETGAVTSAARSSWAANKCAELATAPLRESEISELKSRVSAEVPRARLGVMKGEQARVTPDTNSLLARDASSQMPGRAPNVIGPCPCTHPPTVCWGWMDAAHKRLSPMLSPQRQDSHLEWAALDQKLTEMRKTSTDALRISGETVDHDPVVQPMVGMVRPLERERGRRAGSARRALHRIAMSAHQEHEGGCQQRAVATAPFLRGQREPTEMYLLGGYLGGNLGEYHEGFTRSRARGYSGGGGDTAWEVGA